jgi:hypothetical protein
MKFDPQSVLDLVLRQMNTRTGHAAGQSRLAHLAHGDLYTNDMFRPEQPKGLQGNFPPLEKPLNALAGCLQDKANKISRISRIVCTP